MTSDAHQAGEERSVWWRTKWLEAIYDSELTSTQRFVAMVYADFAGEGRTSWSAISTVMHRTGYSNRAVITARQALIDQGWMIAVAKAKAHKAATYALVIPGLGVLQEDPSDQPGVLQEDTSSSDLDVNEVHPSDHPDVNEVHPRGERGSHLDVNEVHTTNPLEIHHQSSLSPAQRAAVEICGWDERDERLMQIDALIAKHEPRSARSWLRTVHKNGDLDGLLGELEDDQKKHAFWDRHPYAHLGPPTTDWEAERAKAKASRGCDDCEGGSINFTDDNGYQYTGKCPNCHDLRPEGWAS